MRFYASTQLRAGLILRATQRTVILRNPQEGSRTMCGIGLSPVLRKETEDGSEAVISEEELYQYTRYRWLSDESEKLAARYRRFNLEALLEVAVKTAGPGAKSWIKVLKCLEGQYNKAFLMTMDNGVEVLAKIPNPNAGSAFYTTASEVATRSFLQEVLNFPVPRIHTYSLNPLNPVGVEYIIEEKAAGKPLGNLWRHWPRESQLGLINQLVDLEAKLASVLFRKHGCIYYKADLETKGIPTQSLEASISSGSSPKELDASILEKYALGPLTQAVLWEGGRATMALDRGPWANAVDYLMAMGKNEIKWTETFAEPQMNYCRPVDTPELPDEYISLLKRYLTIIPYLLPTIPGELHSKTLCHRDLHLDNIFVDPDTKKINYIIDWQSTAVTEIFFQHEVPPLLPPPGGYKGTLEPPSEGSESVNRSGNSGDILNHYQNLTRVQNPLRWAAINWPHSSTLTQPDSLVSGAWSRNDVFSFRHALITIAAHWKEISPNSTSCPISFTKHELELHNEEMELLEELGTVLHLLQDQNLISVGGRVLREDYERAQAVNERVKEMLMDMVEDEKQKALYEKIWPY